MEQRRNAKAGETEDPEKNPRPAESFCTIPSCDYPGATPPGIEPGSPRLEANSLTTTSPRPRRNCVRRYNKVGFLTSPGFMPEGLAGDGLETKHPYLARHSNPEPLAAQIGGAPTHCATGDYSPHLGEPGSSPAGSPPDFRMWESCRTMTQVGEFSRGSPVSPSLAF
ncbi:hypothetical protein PR048_027175 [Dryococelus australis]|uniref:Uncharacterized protein n=1 Tax=Dryococelus australis TaxID=614101 RepID=A0ABQ9GEP8_9NEOP|nr:hypothetical protein PR048_027175 [Dryococelus australis]